MVIDFITTPIWKALNAEIDRATEEENNINEHIEELEEVSSRAFNELHSGLTAVTEDVSEIQTVIDTKVDSLDEKVELDEKVVATAFRDINDRIENNSFVESDNFKDIVKISQTDYDALSAKNPRTLYMIYE